jgi:RecG-like helicase
MFAEQQRQEIQKMANGPLEGVPEVLLLSAVSVRTFAMDIMGEIDISSKAKEVKHCTCEQLAYNR